MPFCSKTYLLINKIILFLLLTHVWTLQGSLKAGMYLHRAAVRDRPAVYIWSGCSCHKNVARV